MEKGFGSDNHSGVHPKILNAIAENNLGHTHSYGLDPITESTIETFREHFGNPLEVFFVFNGTAANVLSLQSMTHSYNSVLCSEMAHLYQDECGAPEKITGCKLIPLSTKEGKIEFGELKRQLIRLGDQHHTQPKVISITQPTEVGTVYSLEEVKAITDFAKDHNLYVHVDGARLIHAAKSLNVDLKAITRDVGVDVVSFGGTKNGLLIGEAILFFNTKLAQNFKYLRKQHMQLPSKCRLIACQFQTLLKNGLWEEISNHCLKMAQYLHSEVKSIPEVQITYPVQANGVFAKIPREWVKPLREHHFFYVWDEETFEVRWMITFDTTEEDIQSFVAQIKKLSHG